MTQAWLKNAKAPAAPISISFLVCNSEDLAHDNCLWRRLCRTKRASLQPVQGICHSRPCPKDTAGPMPSVSQISREEDTAHYCTMLEPESVRSTSRSSERLHMLAMEPQSRVARSSSTSGIGASLGTRLKARTVRCSGRRPRCARTSLASPPWSGKTPDFPHPGARDAEDPGGMRPARPVSPPKKSRAI